MTAVPAPSPVLVLVPGVAGTSAPGEEPFVLADPAAPQLLVTDLGIVRGEGAFETIGVFDGRPMALAEHLARLQRTADMEDMGALDLGVLERAVHAAIAAHEAVGEMLVRIFVTPGPEAGAPGAARPTAWIHAKASPDYSAPRRGIRVVALDRGIPTTAPATSPWLLAGAKSLSYAVNMAGLREAERRGAQDVLFVSSEGYALEGPTSTLLVRRGDTFTTTPVEAGVLPGTSLGTVFAALRAEGCVCTEELLTPAQIVAADGAWLIASGRLAAPITHLDDVPLTVDHALSERLSDLISGRA
ncbi:aminotransferase class IV [Brachybacterium huguangmaarense]|uniref:Aminotransferase class IV n=1 Tax=Brachybacterium huguangmaarense TaxID=1652028 RepID=A0ABY6G3W3_9MICO|nr:aminotransferase class IV [Brachybacterium huguangmaarense]UYG17775.1 aminotransferase class IV [Brachybacterium huguangmaarense]